MLSLYKKTSLFIIVSVFVAGHLFGQKMLTPSRQSSFYTYIYKISPDDVLRFYKHPDDTLNENILHNPIDSFKTSAYWENELPAGNYLKISADENRLKYELLENRSAYIKLFHNNYNQRFTITDNQGFPVTGARVRFNGRTVDYDEKSDTWHVKTSKKNNIVQVDYNGVANFFKLTEQGYDDNSDDSKGWLSSFRKSIKHIFVKDDDNRYQHVYRVKPNPYNGFMVFNKPMYKPNDTVKFKAYIISNKSKHAAGQKKLLVKLCEGYNNPGRVIGTVNSYRDGAFEYSFALSDTLNLDRTYCIALTDPDVKPGAQPNNNRWAVDPSVLLSGTFKYEEYELKSTSFSMRVDKKEHWRGVSVPVYLKATDENNLPVPDGRVTLTLVTNSVSYYKNKYAFVADTLWKHDLTLDPVGETKVMLPDSIFPAADINYHINARFLNSSNEERQASEYMKFNADSSHIIGNLVRDTLKINYQVLGRETKKMAWVSTIGAKDDTLKKERVALPANIIFNPAAVLYTIETDSTDTDVELKDFTPDLSISGERTADSLFVKVNNPRNLHFWYSVFAGDDLIDAGQTTYLNYKRAYNGQKLVTFLINYIWAGKSRSSQSALVYRKDLLTINVKQPVSVYPGQQVKTDIVVSDAAGKPVANADLTAWALTSKFENYQAPYLPFLGRTYKTRKIKKEFETAGIDAEGSNKLNWLRWSKAMGLDSIAYYQFTHPLKTYKIIEDGIDTITQVAPFIVKMGDIEPVHILYIDEKPVYFSQTQQLQRYSFAVKPGLHSLRFRTAHRNLKIDSVNVQQSKKTILSFNLDAYPGEKLPDTLSKYEADLINNYLVTIVDNFESKMAQVIQDNNLFYLNPSPGSHPTILTGPLQRNWAALAVKGEQPREFLTEANFTYLFEPGLLKQKSIAGRYPFDINISKVPGTDDYRQYVLTAGAADSLWQDYMDNRNNTTRLFHNDELYGETGKLKIERETYKGEKAELIKNVIIYKYDDPDFIRIYPGNTTDFGNLKKGKYRLFFLLRGDKYHIAENIGIKRYGTNYYKLHINPSHLKDSVSIRIAGVVNNRQSIYNYTDQNIENDALKIKEAFNSKYIEAGNFKDIITGQVFGKAGKQPLTGVSVRVSGTTAGAVTDINGRFSIKTPSSGKLIISYIGYITQEIAITPGKEATITLTESRSYLNEVVVVGYGTQMRKALTGSVSSIKSGFVEISADNISNALAGRVAGVRVVNDGLPGTTDKILIRGTTTSTGGNPLYIIDGEIVDNMGSININEIGDITVLKSSAATALYGARAANGVLIINTKKKAETLQPANAPDGEMSTVRKNFSDYAYWQPKLTTDAQGKASFTTTFPDDITNWRTFIAGITENRQTGSVEGRIRSFKPLSANFIAPQFAVAGDEMKLIGKVMNYNSTAVKLIRTFTYNGKQLQQNDLEVKNSKIDTLGVIASATDSLSFEYTIKRDNGYFDGERRKVPVIKQGVEETKGVFNALNGDTTVNLKFDPAMGSVTFRAEASVLPTLAEETRKLRDYKYLCNEQLASKLKGLLAEGRIGHFLGEEFKYSKNILEVIKKLQENRKTNGTWGWWKDTDEELWISLHAVEALLDAQKEGYTVQLDKQKLTDYLVYQLESYHGADKLTCLELLHKLEAKIDYQKYVDVVEKENNIVKQKTGFPLSAYDKLRLMLIKQEAGLPVKLDSLFAKQHHTLFGNMYWGDDSYRFFDNSVQLSILAYRIIKAEGKHPEQLRKIQGYFLEQRSHGEWRNTYESALILETILPDLLVTDKQVKPSAITIKGSTTQTINTFPYSATFKPENISVSKTGSLPVYITGSQKFWNNAPQKVSKEFTVDTWFERKEQKVTSLKGGDVVQLKAEVTAKGDADFVMIEIPIPAGCSYESKDQAWSNNEVHREYFKEKVSIFCRKLKEGKYTFTVNLIPRYDGKYTLNPAKAEMMYFPVFYGREGMKSVVIGSLSH